MSILFAVIALGILIFVHELGHFLVAKRCGIKVERFSLGFGPAIVSRKWGETEYIFAWIPLGGYVKMHGDVPEEWLDKPGLSPEGMGRSEEEDAESPEPIDPSRSYLHKPIPQRIAVAFAGPAFNLIFGYFAIMISLWLTPHPAPVIGSMEENSPAAAAGLQSGDRVLAVDGAEVRFFEDIIEHVRATTGEKITIEFERDGQAMSAQIAHTVTDGMNEFGETIQVNSIGAHPPIGTRVAAVSAGSPADKAGVKRGDEIRALDGKPVRYWKEVSDYVKAGGGAPVVVTVERKGEMLELSMTPELSEVPAADGEVAVKRPLIGVQSAQNFIETRKAGFSYAFANAPSETLRLMILIPMGLYKLVVGDVPRDQVGGPIEIGAQMANAADQGWGPFLFLMALISINLGILNLLPIPVLDGGHIVFFLVEALNRRPISLRTREIAQQVGLSLLLLLMLFAFYNDFRRRVLPGVMELFTG